MTDTITLTAEPRTTSGKGPARRLRREDKIPAVIYGHGRNPEPLVVSRLDFEKVLVAAGGQTAVIQLKIGGKQVRTLIREIQRHPTRLKVTHVDFLEIHAGEKLTVRIPISLEGSPEGVRNQGGILDQILRELEIRVLPKDIPQEVTVDVTGLSVGNSIHVRDLVVENAEVLENPDRTVCTVVPPKVEAEPTVVVEEELEEEAEPELIRKPKAEGEEEGTESED
ncbi:MAG: 50S ribosomal protein L25 [Gemmatimonadales bacterium]